MHRNNFSLHNQRKVIIMTKILNKTFSFLLVLAIFFTLSLLSSASEDSTLIPYAMGDLNGDGKVTAVDARITLRSSAKLFALTDEQEAAADVFYDGKISAVNARKILRASAKLETLGEVPMLRADMQKRIMQDGSKLLIGEKSDYNLLKITNYYGTYNGNIVVGFSRPHISIARPPIEIAEGVTMAYIDYIDTVVWNDGEALYIKEAYIKGWLTLENIQCILDIFNATGN